MSGTLREKYPGIWQVRYEAGRDPLTGRRRQLCRNVRGTKKQAQQVLNALVAEADAGRAVGKSDTFEHLCVRWLTLVENDLSPTTVRTYKNLLSKRIYPALGDRPVSSIRTIDLDDLYQGLTTRVGLSSSTVRQIHAIIRRALRQAILWGWIVNNPATNATPPRLTKADISPPNVDQMGELLSFAVKRDPEFAHFVHLAATTGARRGELCGIRWRHLDIKRKTLLLEKSIAEVPGGLLEKDTKTHSKRRIALGADTLKILRAQRHIAEERATSAGVILTDASFMFSREPDGGTPWTPDSVTKRFATMRDELGYGKMRFHDLRHFVATRLIAAGVPVRTVSGRLGHANPSTTLSVYSHFIEASDQAAARVLDTLVSTSQSKAAKKVPLKKSARKTSQRPH